MPYQRRRPVQLHSKPGLIESCHLPGGFGVRVDSHIYQGYRIPPYYDSLIGKVCVVGKDRDQAMAKMRVALDELAITGIKTNTPLHRDLFSDPGFQKVASASTTWNTGWKNAKPNRINNPLF